MRGVTARGTEEIPQAEGVKQLSEGWCGWGGRDGVRMGGWEAASCWRGPVRRPFKREKHGHYRQCK